MAAKHVAPEMRYPWDAAWQYDQQPAFGQSTGLHRTNIVLRHTIHFAAVLTRPKELRRLAHRLAVGLIRPYWHLSELSLPLHAEAKSPAYCAGSG